MSPGRSLKDREEAASSNAGNVEDGVSPGQRAYDEQFNHIAKASEDEDFDDIISREFGDDPTDTYVDGDDEASPRNYNADPEAERQDLQQQEENPDGSYYTPGLSNGGKQAPQGFWGKFRNGFKQYGASGSIVVTLTVGGGVGGALLAPSSLLVNLEKAVTNDGSEFVRTNIVFRRAYVSFLFKKSSTGPQNAVDEKIGKMTDEQKALWEESGFKVETEDGKIKTMEFPDGTKVDNGPDFLNHAENTLEGRRSTSRVFEVRAGFTMGELWKKELKLFNIEKSKRMAGTTESDEAKKKAALDKNFEDNTGLKAEDPDNPNARLEDLKSKTTESGDFKTKYDAIADKMQKSGNFVGAVGVLCATYNVARLTNATIKAKWVYDLVSFAYPFLRAAAQIVDQGDIEPEVVDYMGQKLTWFDPHERLADGSPNPKFNLSGMDSQGLKMAIYGDFTGLKDWAKGYTSWGWDAADGAGVMTGSLVSTVNDLAGGKQNVKSICSLQKALANGSLALCATSPWQAVACGVALAIGPEVMSAAKGALVAALAYPALEFLAKVDLSPATRGVDAGDALAAGAGWLLSNMSMASGLEPLGGSKENQLKNMYQFITKTNDSYYAYVTQPQIDEAKANPFDVSNQYSFMGQISTAFNKYGTSDGSIFGRVANLFGVMNESLLRTQNTAQALFFQPSNMTLTKNSAANRIGKCEDDEMQTLGFACDYAGDAVFYTNNRVLEGLNSYAAGMNMSKTADVTGVAAGDIIHKSTQYMIDHKQIDPTTFAPVKDSDYQKYLDWCINRQAPGGGVVPMGSSTEPIADDPGDWTDGTRCQNLDPKYQAEIDSFVVFHQMCDVQYASANRKTDCATDQPEDGGSSSLGSGSIAEVAKMMGAWGGQYNACYVYGGGHGKDTEWIKQAIANHFTGDYAVDCSAFVRAVILQATGKDIGDQDTNSLCADTKNFDHIPRGSAQPGDLAIDCANHVEVVVANNNGNFQTVGSHSTGCGPGLGASPGTYQGTANFVLRYKG